MKQNEAVATLKQYDEQLGRYVYLKRDLKKLFNDTADTFNLSLRRLTKAGILKRVAHGVYLYSFSHNIGEETLDLIARNLRRGEITYESLESALSAYGVISQIPIDRRTYMTTGRSGEYRTPYGVIEFTHTKANPRQIIPELKQVRGRRLPVASKRLAWENLKDAHRNTDLVDMEELEDDE
ncbi:hypothetical protein [Bifidobacterium sp. SO1]|uniref:type IV toxin-antitoxin system AbiEi family antitoxin n=1 Tax=Bifidobacterium sp. SO1 TaxID=2809029 RepID=UPI001BDD3040|nr:hypothetical protein [Bifidobacterium sp. SO1]MBT1162190.1 hypothetical protein [Bifidobacterium sp. SO1]